jgi:hypothetical protein
MYGLYVCLSFGAWVAFILYLIECILVLLRLFTIRQDSPLSINE